MPAADAATWTLRVDGLVMHPLQLGLAELRELAAQTIAVTLECAGNGRSLFEPPIEGEQWALGAVSTAEWRGVPLSAVLDRAELSPSATHLVFRSGDRGFERGLRVVEANRALLAYEMNGEALPSAHGGPLRLVVPGWYAVASVKWLTSIDAVDEPFTGYFQKERYVYGDGDPVTTMRVRSLITHPADGATVSPGELRVSGFAWSGSGPIAAVDVSVDGQAWNPATVEPGEAFAWQAWSHSIQVAQGTTFAIRSRATDAAGEVQPEKATWNRLGYGNNSIQAVRVRVA